MVINILKSLICAFTRIYYVSVLQNSHAIVFKMYQNLMYILIIGATAVTA